MQTNDLVFSLGWDFEAAALIPGDSLVLPETFINVDLPVTTALPEPGSLVLLSLGLAGWLIARFVRRLSKQSGVRLAQILAFFTMGAVGHCQTSIYDRTPNTLSTVEGSKTVLGYLLSPDARTISGTDRPSGEVLIHLPLVPRKAAPQLLGMLPHGAEREIFLGWVDPESEPGNFRHHIEILRSARGSDAALVHDFTLFGGPTARVRFFEPPNPRAAPAVLIDIQGGAYWGTSYLLAPDRHSIGKLFDATDYEFSDLDGDGVYELIAWNRRPFDVRCNFRIFGVRFYPEIFVRNGAGYRKAWPPADWALPDGQLEDRFKNHEKEGVPWGANFQIVAGFAALGGNGAIDLVVLQDRLSDEPTQALAIYKLENKSLRLVAQTALPPERIAFLLQGTRDSTHHTEVQVRAATPAKCKAGGIPEGLEIAESAFIVDGDTLHPKVSK